MTNLQHFAVTLSNVQDTSGNTFSSVVGRMDVLIGDTNGDRTVNSGDAQQTRNRSGQATDASNFRSDVNTDGNVNSGDAIIVRARSGTGF
ncbi:MAG: dockerin type I domain-containing protein [Verrucomicrobiota bacterium]|nr:dockerin type I domain-containing protein [Verrucomicrobiota bacterium]